MIFTIAYKEFRTLLLSPSTWIIFGALQFIFAWFFLARLDAFLQVQAQYAQQRGGDVLRGTRRIQQLCILGLYLQEGV